MDEDRIKVTRTIIIEGPSDWVQKILSESFLSPWHPKSFKPGTMVEVSRKITVVPQPPEMTTVNPNPL